MNKSIEFIKKRISSGQISEWVPKSGWENAYVHNPLDYILLSCYDPGGWLANQFSERNGATTSLSRDGHSTTTTLLYDPDGKFEYVHFDYVLSDGTLLFPEQLKAKVALTVLGMGTYNIQTAPSDIETNWYNYIWEYTIGDLIELHECGNFETKEKPFLKMKTTIGLPISIKYISKHE